MGDAAPKYRALADEVASHVASGRLRPGQRLPSVRTLCRERGLGNATVRGAFRLLVERGVVEPRPRAGYFVRRPGGALPRASRSALAPARVAIGGALGALAAAAGDRGALPLGFALLSPELLPLDALDRTLAAIARSGGGAGGEYAPARGAAALRRAIAARLVRQGASVHEDEIVVTSGATEALHLALRVTCAPGDAVAVASPSYFGILKALELLGLRAVEIASDPERGLDLDQLEIALDRARPSACIAVPAFDNPLGARMGEASKERLVSLLARRGVPLIEDDVYGDLGFEGPRPAPAARHDRGGDVLLAGSFSKTLAPGYRVGWLAPGRRLAAVERLKYLLSLANPTLPQLAVAEFLRRGHYDRHLRGLRPVLTETLARARPCLLDAFPEGTRVSSPAGGFVLWVEMPPAFDALALQDEARRRGITLAPGPLFSARGRFRNCLRVACGMRWTPALEAALRTLGALARAQRAGPRAAAR
ncbi:MAG TPA: PLP-dependent aminotransferase family protein [Polyangiaceae bacterium]|nr:PLP-dependent aminotransferase family protein [Polyangiaceae bacterium]